MNHYTIYTLDDFVWFQLSTPVRY